MEIHARTILREGLFILLWNLYTTNMLEAAILRLKSLLGTRERDPEYVSFRDYLGNFSLQYPRGWKYDKDIAVVEGRYTNSFCSGNGLSQFTISVDALVHEKFNFPKYAKDELSSPSSGIYTPLRKSGFRGLPAYSREYGYCCGSREFFGGGVMFYTGELVFSISWSAPGREKANMEPVFRHMLDSLSFRERYFEKKRESSMRKMKEMEVGGIRET